MAVIQFTRLLPSQQAKETARQKGNEFVNRYNITIKKDLNPEFHIRNKETQTRKLPFFTEFIRTLIMKHNFENYIDDNGNGTCTVSNSIIELFLEVKARAFADYKEFGAKKGLFTFKKGQGMSPATIFTLDMKKCEDYIVERGMKIPTMSESEYFAEVVIGELRSTKKERAEHSLKVEKELAEKQLNSENKTTQKIAQEKLEKIKHYEEKYQKEANKRKRKERQARKREEMTKLNQEEGINFERKGYKFINESKVMLTHSTVCMLGGEAQEKKLQKEMDTDLPLEKFSIEGDFYRTLYLIENHQSLPLTIDCARFLHNHLTTINPFTEKTRELIYSHLTATAYAPHGIHFKASKREELLTQDLLTDKEFKFLMTSEEINQEFKDYETFMKDLKGIILRTTSIKTKGTKRFAERIYTIASINQYFMLERFEELGYNVSSNYTDFFFEEGKMTNQIFNDVYLYAQKKTLSFFYTNLRSSQEVLLKTVTDKYKKGRAFSQFKKEQIAYFLDEMKQEKLTIKQAQKQLETIIKNAFKKLT